MNHMNPARAAMIGTTAMVPGTNALGIPMQAIATAAGGVAQEQIGRTVYIGNLPLVVSTEQLEEVFKVAGGIAYIKIAGTQKGAIVPSGSQFAFIEFKTRESADRAMAMSGVNVAGVNVKVGRANNPIIKSGPGTLEVMSKSESELEEIMRKVREATADIDHKVEKDEKRSRSRSRSRGRRKRSRRSRSRDRRRDSDRRSRRRRSRSGDRYSYRAARRSPPRPKKKAQPDHAGEYFDGYSWKPIEAAGAYNTPTAAAVLQNTGIVPPS